MVNISLLYNICQIGIYFWVKLIKLKDIFLCDFSNEKCIICLNQPCLYPICLSQRVLYKLCSYTVIISLMLLQLQQDYILIRFLFSLHCTEGSFGVKLLEIIGLEVCFLINVFFTFLSLFSPFFLRGIEKRERVITTLYNR